MTPTNAQNAMNHFILARIRVSGTNAPILTSYLDKELNAILVIVVGVFTPAVFASNVRSKDNNGTTVLHVALGKI